MEFVDRKIEEHYGQQTEAALRVWAEKHANSSPMLQLLPESDVPLDAQAFTTHQVEGHPIESKALLRIASETPLPKLTEKITAAEAKPQYEISRLGELLKSGQNVMLVTDHGELPDVGFALAAVGGKLRDLGYEFASDIVVSKMVAYLSYKIGDSYVPILNLLQLISNRISLSLPRTESTEAAGVPKLAIDIYNHELGRTWDSQLDGRHKGPGTLFAIAASGTVDKSIPGLDNSILLERIGRGTFKLMRRGFVQPVAIWLKDKEPVLELCDIPRTIEDEAEAHDIMRGIARTLSDHVPNKTFIYSENVSGKKSKNVGRVATKNF